MSVKAGNIKKGSYISFRGEPYYVVKTQFVSPGKGSAFNRTKLRAAKTGNTVEFVFKSHESVEELEVDSREMQFLYADAENVVFMDPRSYEQTEVPIALLEDKMGCLVPELHVYIMIYQEKAIGVTLPPKIVATVIEAEEAVAGDRQTAGKKPVKIETGMIVQAPLFVHTGDKLIIDTETGAYVSRSN